MNRLKLLLEMIENKKISTREELEVFYDRADIITDKYGEFIITDMGFIITDMGFIMADKPIFVNITDMLADDMNKEEYLEELEKHLPLEIQNPKCFSVENFDNIIDKEVRKNYIASLGSSLTYLLFIAEDGDILQNRHVAIQEIIIQMKQCLHLENMKDKEEE